VLNLNTKSDKYIFNLVSEVSDGVVVMEH